MPKIEAIARSPIAPSTPEVIVTGWAVSGCQAEADLTLVDCTPMAKVAVKAPSDGEMARALDVPYSLAVRQTRNLRGEDLDVLVIGSGPGEWLVLAPAGTAGLVIEHLAGAGGRRDELQSILDLTHGRALVRLAGAHSAAVLAKECGVDLSNTACPDGAAFRSAVAALATEVVRDDRGGARSYLLHCERSSGQYLFDSLLDAGAEFGIEVDGYVLPG